MTWWSSWPPSLSQPAPRAARTQSWTSRWMKAPHNGTPRRSLEARSRKRLEARSRKRLPKVRTSTGFNGTGRVVASQQERPGFKSLHPQSKDMQWVSGVRLAVTPGGEQPGPNEGMMLFRCWCTELGGVSGLSQPSSCSESVFAGSGTS